MENVPKLELVEVVLMHCNVINNDYQQAQKYYIHLYRINNLGN